MFSIISNKQTGEEIREALSTLVLDPEISIFFGCPSSAPLIGLLKKLEKFETKYSALRELIRNTLVLITKTETILKHPGQKKERNKELVKYAAKLLTKYFPTDPVVERAERFATDFHEICNSIKHLRSSNKEAQEAAKNTLMLSFSKEQNNDFNSNEGRKKKKLEENSESERMSVEAKETNSISTPHTLFQVSAQTLSPLLLEDLTQVQQLPLILSKQNTCCNCKRNTETVEYRLRGGSFCCSQCFDKETILQSLFSNDWEASSLICILFS
jgi:hypothetical protein